MGHCFCRLSTHFAVIEEGCFPAVPTRCLALCASSKQMRPHGALSGDSFRPLLPRLPIMVGTRPPFQVCGSCLFYNAEVPTAGSRRQGVTPPMRSARCCRRPPSQVCGSCACITRGGTGSLKESLIDASACHIACRHRLTGSRGRTRRSTARPRRLGVRARTQILGAASGQQKLASVAGPRWGPQPPLKFHTALSKHFRLGRPPCRDLGFAGVLRGL